MIENLVKIKALLLAFGYSGFVANFEDFGSF